jgi:hypothetical protein
MLKISKLRTSFQMRKQHPQSPGLEHQLGLPVDVIEVIFEELLAQLVNSQAQVMFTEYVTEVCVHMSLSSARPDADSMHRVKR